MVPLLVGQRQSLGGVTAKVKRLEQDRDAGGRHIGRAGHPAAYTLCGHQRRKS